MVSREDIIRMALETYGPYEFSEAGLIYLERFAALVAAAEQDKFEFYGLLVRPEGEHRIWLEKEPKQ